MCVNISAPHSHFFAALQIPTVFSLPSPCQFTPRSTVRPVKNRGTLQRMRDYLLSISADDLPEDVLEPGVATVAVALVAQGGALDYEY